MNVLKSKNLYSMLAVLMMLSFVVSMVAVPNANAQNIQTPSWPFVDALPNPAGVGQPVLINWGLLNYIPSSDLNDGFNVTMQITYPNGKVENHTAKTWSTGTVGKKIAFNEPGNYTLQAIYDGENNVKGAGASASSAARDYLPAESEIVTLQIVEGYWKPSHPGHSLPAEYWTRPVDSQLREWYSIMGSWFATPVNMFAPYNEAPESAHILWSMPIGDAQGGLYGGDAGMIGAQLGDAYEGKFKSSVILNGVLYYNREQYSFSNNALYRQLIVAVDLHTGKVLWERNYDFGGSRITRGQIITFLNQNNRGAWSYLWMASGTTWYALNPANGDLVYNMTSVPSGTVYYGPSGEMLIYPITYNATTNTLRVRQWNSTYLVEQAYSDLAEVTYSTRMQWGNQVNNPALTDASQSSRGVTAGGTNGARSYNANFGYDRDWNITGVTNNPGSVRIAFPMDRLIIGSYSVTDGVYLTAISLNEDDAGRTIFLNRHFAAPNEWKELETGNGQSNFVAFSDDPYVAILWLKESRENYAFSLETGRYLWKSEPQMFADAWSDASSLEKHIVYGKLFESSVSGIVYCYDAATGELLWTYENKDKYTESYHRENWWTIPVAFSSGKAYFGHYVHSPQEPKPRGAPFFALDVETGELVWEIDGAFRQTRWGDLAVMGDSIIATMDTYDQQIYAIGKGPSEMTVSVSNAITTAGTPIMVSGTVMDVSPGTQSDNLRMRFPSGVPAVGDESMSDWMLYLYKQFEQPMSVTGIEITVYAWDGENVIDIGKTTSDARGRFSIPWTPEQTGEYDIWAYFEGTASYFGSDAKSEVAVFAAPEVVEQEIPPYGWYIIGATIAIIITVILSVLLVGMWLKKK